MLHCSAVSVIVLGLMALGTGYDLYLVHQSRHFFSKNYTYEITRVSPPHLGEGPIKVDVGNFIQTGTSGATGGVINHGMLPVHTATLEQYLCCEQSPNITTLNRSKPTAPEFAVIYFNISLNQLIFAIPTLFPVRQALKLCIVFKWNLTFKMFNPHPWQFCTISNIHCSHMAACHQ